jgi:G6PDH family F420-dependent oxidoreductase
VQIGYKLATEAFGPQEIVRQAVAAEQAGFDFVEMSDHYHPWVEAQGHSGFTWSILGVIAAKTERIGLATGVTCPSVRYHPAIIAQAAATMAIVSGGRFTLGVGAGERLNEHVIGTGFQGAGVRHERFREALEIIRLLWQGGYHSYQGRYLQLEDARVFDLPEELPVIAVAASGPESVRIAADLGDGLFATEPDAEVVRSWRQLGGSGPAYAEMPLAWAPDEDSAVQAIMEKSRFAMTGWKVMAELPNPVNFEAAVASITPDQVRGQFACGPDVQRHLEVAQPYVDAGFDRLVAMNNGPDPDGFMEFFARELAAPLRSLTPSRAAAPGAARETWDAGDAQLAKTSGR